MAYQVSDGLGIADATIGISKKGLENYTQELQFSVINDTKEALRDYQGIVTTIGTSWNGTAAQKFVNNFDASTQKACDALDEISKAIGKQNKAIIGIKDNNIAAELEKINRGDVNG